MHSPSLKPPFEADTLLQIAHEFGTPTYVYDERVIRQQCGLLKKHLSGIKTRLLYAMKANSQPAILEIIRSEGFGIDAVSPGELYLARKVGFTPDEILYTANNITDEEMHLVQQEGVLLNLGELSRLERFGKAYPGADVCIRLNPQIGSGHHEHVVTAGKTTKFGIPIQEIQEILRIANQYDLKITGIHQHIGSGISSMQVLGEAITVLLEHAVAFPDLQFINIGGGFNIPYHSDDTPIDFENFESAIVSLLQRTDEQTNHQLEYWFEPGRFLVAESGILLARANTIKESNERTFAGTDTGMNQLLRPALYQAYHEIINISNVDAAASRYEIVGNICESGDIFAKSRPVQQIREGDILAILDAGAYGMSMASVYNLRPTPAEILIRTDGRIECVLPRQNPKELIDRMFGTYFEQPGVAPQP